MCAVDAFPTIRGEHRQHIGALSKDRLIDQVKRHGAVIISDFDVTEDSFLHLTSEIAPGTKRGVFPTEAGLQLHGELYWTPYPPDILWFFCIEPSAAGGETVLCDGAKIAANMSKATKQFFYGNPLVYHRTMGVAQWQRLFRSDTGDGVLKRISPYPNCSASFTDEGVLHLRLTHYAIRHSKWSGEEAFVNSLLHALENEGREGQPQYGLQTKIPDAVVQEVHCLAKQFSTPFLLRQNEILAIDNTRVMHGRLPFTGARKIIAVNGRAVF